MADYGSYIQTPTTARILPPHIIGNANVNLKNIYSMITTALVTGRKYQIKFQANGVNCFDGGQHADWLGGWLL